LREKPLPGRRSSIKNDPDSTFPLEGKDYTYEEARASLREIIYLDWRGGVHKKSPTGQHRKPFYTSGESPGGKGKGDGNRAFEAEGTETFVKDTFSPESLLWKKGGGNIASAKGEGLPGASAVTIRTGLRQGGRKQLGDRGRSLTSYAGRTGLSHLVRPKKTRGTAEITVTGKLNYDMTGKRMRKGISKPEKKIWGGGEKGPLHVKKRSPRT